MGERAEWSAEVRLVDGRLLTCRFSPLAGGSTLAGFSLSHVSPTRLIENHTTTAPIVLEKMPG